MRRREMLKAGSAALLGWGAMPSTRIMAAERKPRKLLYFTRSVQYEHSVVRTGKDGLSHSQRVLQRLGGQLGFEIEATKDGRVFDRDLGQYDGFVAFTCGNLFEPSIGNTPPMSAAGLRNLVDAVRAGKPFVGLHSSCYWGKTTPKSDSPYLTMIGAQFIEHGPQQEAAMRVASPDFPGVEGLGRSFRLLDEWYAMKNFSRDMRVILVQETDGMKGRMYQRPPFPSTWARMHGKGRVFYSAMGHREDVWSGQPFQQILSGGIAWALGDADAVLEPNIDRAAPRAEELPRG